MRGNRERERAREGGRERGREGGRESERKSNNNKKDEIYVTDKKRIDMPVLLLAYWRVVDVLLTCY